MTPFATAVWLGNLAVDTCGHLCFKGASADAKELDGMAHWKALAAHPLMWIGVASFVVEFFLWLALLSLVPLAQGVMVGCVNILGVMLGGRLFFGEKLTHPRIVAITLIAVGVALVGWGGAQ